jgi:hypothetical protein
MSQHQNLSPILQQITDKQSQIDELCQRHQVARLEIFGSATSNRFQDPTSDIDFLVEFTVNTPQGAADRFFGLKQGLSDLFERAIDLVEIQTIQNPYFLEAIGPQRLQIYGN